ncbi:MAG: hypothetical protein HY747_03780 [Elusimicrobia bacterium]|nr:hypothetical protein [Elusimicrobiota bacterium]
MSRSPQFDSTQTDEVDEAAGSVKISRRISKTFLLGAWLVAGAACRAAAAGEEPGPRRWINLRRPRLLLELRAERDSSRMSQGGVSLGRREEFFDERLRGDLSGHIYDERFIGFDLRAGGVASQSRLKGQGERFPPARDYEYRARLGILPKHAVSADLSAERSQQTSVFNAFAGRSKLEYSHFNGTLLYKGETLPFNLSYRQTALKGGGFGAPFYQTTRGLSLGGRFGGTDAFSAHLRQEAERFRDSLGEGYDFVVSGAEFDGRFTPKNLWNARSSFMRRTGILAVENWSADGAWQVLEKNLKIETRGGLDSRRVAGQRAGYERLESRLEHRLFENLTTNLQCALAFTRQDRGRENAREASLDERYIKRVWGPLRLGLGFRKSLRITSRKFDSLSAAVVDEPHSLSDGAPSFLDKLGIDPASVIVAADDHTRQYAVETDYILIVHGQSLELRRVPTGNIVNGQTVLVSYRYEIPGARRAADDAEEKRAEIFLGSRGSLFVVKNRQAQRVRGQSLDMAGDQETFNDLSRGLSMRWKYFSTMQTWQKRRSNTAPLKSFRSELRLGGALGAGLSAVAGWSYERTRFLAGGQSSLGQTYFGELTAALGRNLQTSLEGYSGRTVTIGMEGSHQTATAKLRWSYRSLDLEISDREARRRLAGSSSRENFLQARILREF